MSLQQAHATATLVNKSGIAKCFAQAPYVTQSAIVAEHMLSLVCFCHKDPIILHYHFSLQLNEMACVPVFIGVRVQPVLLPSLLRLVGAGADRPALFDLVSTPARKYTVCPRKPAHVDS